MTDAKAIPTKTKTEAATKVAQMKAAYTNVALIGPVTSVEVISVANASWLVVATNAKITIESTPLQS